MSDDDFYQDDAQPEQADPYAGLGELGYSDEETAATRQVLQGVIDHHVRQAIEPVQRDLEYVTGYLQAEEHAEQLAELEDRYPALQRDDVADELLAQAREIAQQRGDPELATDPEFLELVYLRSGAGGAQRQQAQRSSPGRVGPGGVLQYDQGTPESEAANDALLAAQPRGNVFGY